MDSTTDFSSSKEIFNVRTSIRIYSKSSHMVVCSWGNFHRLFSNIHSNIKELFKHGFKLLFNELWVEMANIKVNSSMFASSAFHDFIVNGSCNYVSCSKFHPIIIAAHEPFPFAVYESSSFSPYSFSYKHSFS